MQDPSESGVKEGARAVVAQEMLSRSFDVEETGGDDGDGGD